MGTATLTQAGATAANADASGTSFNAKTGATAEIAVTANNAGAAYNGVEINFVADQKATGTEYASYDSTSKILTFHIASGDTAANVVKYANQNSSQSVLNLFTIALPTGSAGGGTVTANDMGWLTGGVTYSGGSGAVAGQGNFDAGQVVGATGLTLQSTGYGSSQSVSVNTLTGSFATYNAANVAATQANGTDAGVQINGVNGVANGLNVSLGTGNLGLSFNLNSGVTAGSNFNFQITGGGALFQLGANIVSNEQANLGIGNMNTANLGGTSGMLYELGSGNDASLANNAAKAAQIVNDATNQVNNLRGYLGAFTAETLDTNVTALTNSVQNLTSADSSIADADFAAESANVSRAQVLVQAGTQVLSIAEQTPQNVLTLLRNM